MKQSLLLVSLSIFISLTGCGGGSSSSVERPPEPPPVTPPPVDPVTPAPAVTALTPNNGPVTGNTTVTITGTDFTGATAIKFGANNAKSFTVDSATQVTAVTPAGTVGQVDVIVTTTAGSNTPSSAGKFTYTAVVPSAAGLWQGVTDADQAIGGVVRAKADGGAYWLVYSSASSTVPSAVTATNAAGFITGAGTETVIADSSTNGSFASPNLREFNFAGIGLAAGSLSAGYTEKTKFGQGLTGAGIGTFTSNASPPTLSNGTTDANLPVPGFSLPELRSSAVTNVLIGGAPGGSGTATGESDLPSSTTFVFSSTGRTDITGLTATTNTQRFTLQGTFTAGTFTATSGIMEVTDCVNHLPPPDLNGCDFAGPSSPPSTMDSVSGSVGPAGGTIVVTYNLLGAADITSTFTFTAVDVTNNPANPTFTDGGAPWTITATSTPALSGTLAFESYTTTITEGSSTTTLNIPERKLTIDGTQGTLVYNAGTNTLTLTGTTITDTSGPMTCTGAPAICGSGPQPISSTSQLTADVVFRVGVPAAGEYEAEIFIGGQSSPESVLSFDGTLALVPSTTVNFTTDYLAAYETPATLVAVQGSHSGSAGVGSTIQPGASFSIDSAGALTAGVEASGCAYVGNLTPVANANVYNVTLTFTAGGSCGYSGSFTGAAFFDEENKLTITATNADRDQGFLFIAQ